MTARLDPPLMEFETDHLAASHDRWFRAEVDEAINSPKPRVPHDEAIARVDALMALIRSERAGRLRATRRYP